jgi:hypothetical protein
MKIEINFVPNSFAIKDGLKALGAKFQFGQWQLPLEKASALVTFLESRGGQTAEAGKGFSDGLKGIINEGTPWTKAGNIAGLATKEEIE